MFPLMLMIAWVLFVADFVKKLVHERELRLHEVRMMSISDELTESEIENLKQKVCMLIQLLGVFPSDHNVCFRFFKAGGETLTPTSMLPMFIAE